MVTELTSLKIAGTIFIITFILLYITHGSGRNYYLKDCLKTALVIGCTAYISSRLTVGLG